MRAFALLLSALICCKGLEAQLVTGFARDDKGKPLQGASVALRSDKDSSVVKFSISTTNGQYEFSPVPAGRYFVTISHTGYAPGSSATFETLPTGAVQAPGLALRRAAAELRQVVVSGRKPPVEVKNDRIILNVDGNINQIGTDALELLRKSPGVTVDKDNNLALNGKNGVEVYVDGRPTYISGATLADYLKGLSSSSIESIEIISNPSAKYDAAGNAGIIDIRLKKNTAFGTNLTLSSGYNIGTYSKYNAAVSFNHRDAHVNLYGDYSFNDARNETYATMTRRVLDTSYLQHSTLLQTPVTHTYKAGIDWFIDKRSTLGLVVNGSSYTEGIRATSATPIVYIPTNRTDRILQANNHTDESRDNLNTDLAYRFADSAGHELNIDADYGVYHLRSNQAQPNDYFDSTGKTLLYHDDYNILSPTDIHIYSVKADYQQNFGKGKLGFGLKSSYVRTANSFEVYDLHGSGSYMDSLSSNDFDYRENINAAYVNYERAVKGWAFQGGLRAENTNMKGTSTGFKQGNSDLDAYDSTFTRHYTDLFPSASITYNYNPQKQWTLSFSRRIDRPAYQELNPFQFKEDDYTFSQGNTQLRPQYSNSAGLTFLYKYKLSATLSYSHISDLSTTLVDTTDASKEIVRRENLANQDIVSLSLTYPFSIKWYTGFVSATGFYQLNKANFGVGREVDLNVFNTTIFSQHSFQLGRGWTGQLTQYFVSPNIWQATLQSHSMWSVDGGLQKTLLGGKGTFRVSVTDIFNTLHWTATSNFAGQYIRTTGGYESRQLKLYFTYRLGNRQLKAAGRHGNAAEEENKRVGSGDSGGAP